MTSTASFLWHDYETFGRDPTRERPVQFAAIRTDENLEEVDDGTMIYCRQTPDYLPDPESCLVHGVLPQLANEKGMGEWEFATTIHQLMMTPGTCTVGYNNIRFDDEFTRQLLFRNLFDPYSREWRNGNSRWDLIDVVRLTRALRPDGIEWPLDADNKPSNKLELITSANGIAHSDAHDALADVRATIAVAKLLKQNQPRLFDYVYKARSKKWILNNALDLVNQTPVLHISGMYPASCGHLSMVIPLGPHPTNPNGVMVYDLRHDPVDLIKLSAEQLTTRIFTRAADLPEGINRIAVKTIHANRSPVIVPVKTLDEVSARRWDLDRNLCMEHREKLLAATDVMEKLTQVFTSHDKPVQEDPELTLYTGQFANNRDKNMMESLQKKFGEQKSNSSPFNDQNITFDDHRLNELYFRLNARNWPELLDNQTGHKWRDFCHKRVHLGQDGFRSITEYRESIEAMAVAAASQTEVDRVNLLREYGDEVANFSTA